MGIDNGRNESYFVSNLPREDVKSEKSGVLPIFSRNLTLFPVKIREKQAGCEEEFDVSYSSLRFLSEPG